MLPWRHAVTGRGRAEAATGAPLLYCGQHYIGSCQRDGLSGRYGARAAMLNPELVGAAATLTYSLAQGQLSNEERSAVQEVERPPSTGMVAVAAALSSCEQVSVFGFSFSRESEDGAAFAQRGHRLKGHLEDAGRRSRCAKYYGCAEVGSYFKGGAAFHDWSLQRHALRRLAGMRLVRVPQEHWGVNGCGINNCGNT